MTPEEQEAYNKAEAKTISELAAQCVEMSDEDLAGRIVGLLIRDKGSLNKYQRTIEFAIKLIREIDRITQR